MGFHRERVEKWVALWWLLFSRRVAWWRGEGAELRRDGLQLCKTCGNVVRGGILGGIIKNKVVAFHFARGREVGN